MDDCLLCPCIPDSHPHRLTNTKCCIYTVTFPHDGHTVERHCRENKYTKKNFATSWFNLQDYTGMHGQQNKFVNLDLLLATFQPQIIPYSGLQYFSTLTLNCHDFPKKKFLSRNVFFGFLYNIYLKHLL